MAKSLNNIIYYSIGEAAKYCNLTVKQIRYYDSKGIIIPSFRNEQTGYRYYSKTELKKLMLLNDFKQLGMPIKNIARMLVNHEYSSLQQELENCRLEAREQLSQAQHYYDQVVDTQIRISRSMAYITQSSSAPSISIVHIPRQLIATQWHSFDRDIRDDMPGLIYTSELTKALKKYNLNSVGPTMQIVSGNCMSQFSSDTSQRIGVSGFAVRLAANTSETAPLVSTFGDFQAICAIHTGDYISMEHTYRSMFAFAADQKIELDGSSIEEYLINLLIAPDASQLVTKLYLPFAHKNNSRVNNQ